MLQGVRNLVDIVATAKNCMVAHAALANVINKWLTHGFDNVNLVIFTTHVSTDMGQEKTGH